MRDEVIASQPNDWRDVVTGLLGRVPGDKPICYQKHMTHHMIPAFGRGWLAQVRNAFLIRDPAAVLASYVAKRAEVTLADIGIVQQRELFEQEADRLGRAPPVVEGADILADPARALARLCAALGIAYDDAMLHWPAGRRATDGVWAPAWYDAVERSTGFEPPAPARRRRWAANCSGSPTRRDRTTRRSPGTSSGKRCRSARTYGWSRPERVIASPVIQSCDGITGGAGRVRSIHTSGGASQARERRMPPACSMDRIATTAESAPTAQPLSTSEAEWASIATREIATSTTTATAAAVANCLRGRVGETKTTARTG